jgi:sterol desaturase/sphingolipid hydroxylase (fatty acid hydroxylase superfamily)
MLERIELAATSLLWLAAMFYPLEWAFPAWRGQKRWRPGWLADLAFFLGQHLLFSALVVSAISWLSSRLPAGGVPGWLGMGEVPLWTKALVAIVGGDLAMYAGHRLQHRCDLLWRFHSVHHTTTHLDWLAAHREHPLDGLYTQTLMNLPAIAVGLHVDAVLGLVAFRALWAIFIHSNARMPLGPLRMLLGSPELHHWHHARDREAGNYANLAPYLDWIFGTYRRPASEPTDLGIDEEHPEGYVGLLLHPFRARRTAQVDAVMVSAVER